MGAVPYESKSRAEPAKMKFLALLLLVALAHAEPESAPDAEADAEAAPWYYGYYGHPGYYGGWGGYYGRRWGDTTDMDTHTDTGGNVMLNQKHLYTNKNVKPKKLKPNQLCCMLDTMDTTLPPFTTELPGIHMPTIHTPLPILP